MQTVNAALQAELDKGQVDPRVLVDLYELYESDYTPGVSGFVPADAIETFAAQEITWNAIAYRRNVTSRSNIVKSITEKTNTVTLNFSNVDRYAATLAQTTQIEGLLLVIRCVAPSVTTDSLVLFVGRCDKPSDIDKTGFTLTARQDFGNINVTVPPRKFTVEDPEGRLPSDPLYEGINLIGIQGSFVYPQVVPSTSFFGRLFGRRKTIPVTQQWSSTDNTPYGQVIPEVFGRCQMQAIMIAWADKGTHVGFLGAFSNGPISAIQNLKTRTPGLSDPVCNFANPPASAVIHLGDPGGTGTNNGNTCQADLGSGQYFSHLAYVEGAFAGAGVGGGIVPLGVDVADEVGVLTGTIRGRKVTTPDGSGVFNQTEWSDNPAYIARFILTDPAWCNIDPDFMDDSVLWDTGKHCDFPVIDHTNTQVIIIQSTDATFAGTSFKRYKASGLYTARHFLYYHLGDTSIIPEMEDGGYIAVDPVDGVPDPSVPASPAYIEQHPLIKRYRANFPVTEEVRAVDLLYKILFPSFKGYMRVSKQGKYQILSERPSDATRLRTATAVGDTSIPILNVTPWKSGELLKGRVLLGFGLTTSEVRTVSAAVYSTSGNSVTLSASDTGTVTATASGATLSGGSTTVQASGTVTIGGTPAAGDTVTATIDGVAVTYILEADDTTGTTAAMLAYYINANQRLNKYILASWASGSPTIVTITCLHGALTVPALLNAHDTRVADPAGGSYYANALGGSLVAGDYLIGYADEIVTGDQTSMTPLSSVTTGNTGLIAVSGLPAFPARVVARNFYMSERVNSENLKFLVRRTNVSNFNILDVPTAGGANPPSSNTTAEELLRVAMSFATNSQDLYPVWPASQAVVLNDFYLPTTANGHRYKVTTAGTTGATEPTWPTTAGGTVASGSVTFTEFGSTVLQQAGLTRANIVKDTFKWPLGSRQSSVNQIKGHFRDSKQDFALTPYTVNDRAHQDLVKKVYPLEMDLSAVDNENQMARLGNWQLSKNREGDHFHAFGAGPAALVLEEGDVICASDDSGGLINIVTRIEELSIKPNHEVDIVQSRRYSTLMFSDDAGAHRIPLASTLKFVATKNTTFELIDNFPIRDEDAVIPGWYVVASHDLADSGDWRGYRILVDYGDGNIEIINGDVPALMGTADTTLGSVSDPSKFDRTNSFTFTLVFDDESLASVTELELLANSRRNLFLVGNEYMQAATITSLGDHQYTASILLRGRFGTDSWQLTHGASERVIYLNGAEQFLQIDPVRINTEFDYTAVTTNQDDADGVTEGATWTGGTVKPLSVVNITGTRNTALDLRAKFTRRSRFGPGLRPFSDVPLGEETETYEADIYDGVDVVRTLRTSFSGPVNEPAQWVAQNFGDDKVTADDEGSLAFSDAAEARCLQSLAGDFVVEIGANPSNADLPNLIAIVPRGSEGNTFVGGGGTPKLLFSRSGVDNSDVTITDVVNSISGSDDTDMTYPARYFIARRGSTLNVYRNSFDPTSTPIFTSAFKHEGACSLVAIQTDVFATSAIYRARFTLPESGNRFIDYPATMQVQDFGTEQAAVTLRIFQISSIVGRGDYRSATI